MAQRGLGILGAVGVLALLAGCVSTGPITPAVTRAGVDPDSPGYLIATGRVSGISEDGGTCVFTFWAKTGVATRLSGTGRAENGHTECGPVDQPLGFMVGVNYEAELRYVSLAGESFVSERVPMVLPRPTPNPR